MRPLLLFALLASAQDLRLPDDDSALDLHNKKGRTASAAGTAPAGSWGGNTIYVWFLPTGKALYGPAAVKSVVEAGNGYLAKLGVNTRMVGLVAPSPLDAAGLDDRDVIALVGEKAEVLAVAKSSKLFTEAENWVEQDWQPGHKNPELGLEKEKGKKGVVVISASSAKSYASLTKGKITKEQALALLAIHGSGHVAGIKHSDNEKSFMDDGAYLVANLSGAGGFISNGVLVRPVLTPIDDLFKPDKFATLADSSYSKKYQPEKTMRKAWLALFGTKAPSSKPPVCAAHPKWCL